MAEFMADDIEAAGEHLRQAAGLAAECGNEYVLLLAEACGAGVELREGRMESAEARATMAVELAERRGWTTTAAAAQAYLSLAAIRIWTGDLASAATLWIGRAQPPWDPRTACCRRGSRC